MEKVPRVPHVFPSQHHHIWPDLVSRTSVLPTCNNLLRRVGRDIEDSCLARGVGQEVNVQTARVEPEGSLWVDSRTVGATVLQPGIS